jgi:hypothetical protein
LLLLLLLLRVDHPRPGTNSFTLVGFRSDDPTSMVVVVVVVVSAPVVVAVLVVDTDAAVAVLPGFHSGAPVDKPISLDSKLSIGSP